MKKIILALIASLAINISASAEEKLNLDGSTTVGPIAKAFAEYYMSKNPDVNVLVSESGSGNGAKSLINGTCDIANMSRFMKAKEFKAAAEKGVMPVAHAVAMDGLAIVVHPSNPIKEITVAQIKDIYTGKITNWKDLGGADMEIVMISRDTNSGTFETFNKLVMKKAKIVGDCEYVGSNGGIRQRVQSTKGAIGYLGVGFLDESVKDLLVDGKKCTARSIATGKYPIARALYMFTNGYPKLGSHTHAFVTIHLTPKGQEMIEEIGYVAITEY